MADMIFNTSPGTTVERNQMVLYLNTGTSAAPVWSPVGKRVEDSALEYDWGEESKTDIFGDTYTSLKRPITTQTFDPCELDSGDVAQVRIWNMAIRERNVSAMANNDMMVAHLYAGDADAVFAERYGSCAVKPSTLGGSSTMGMPIDVTYGGKRTKGTAEVADDVVTFAPAV